MAEYKSFRERFDWLLGFMAMDDPFTHELLMLLHRAETNRTPTMAVSVEGSEMTLHYNRQFFESLSDEEVRGVFTHEMSHLAFHHCTRRGPSDKALRKKHNVAADLAVNSIFVPTGYRRLPKDALMPEKYKFEGKLSLEQYYALLPDQEKDDKDKGSKGKGKDKGEGGAGDKGDDQAEDQQGGGQGDDQEDNQGSDHDGFDDHSLWSDDDNQIADEIIRQKIREMENSDRYWGNMPGDIKQMILEAQKSRIAWYRMLRCAYGQLTSKNITHTFKRPNRRFGYPYTGFKKDYIDRVLLLWDLSGSIHDSDLSRFLAETNRLAEQQPVDVQMFDNGLQGKLLSFNRKLKKIAVTGRGGTSFKEPFEFADKMRYGSVICFTDGCAPAIPRPRFVKNIIWAIVGLSKPPVPWGRAINIDTINGQPIPADAQEIAA